MITPNESTTFVPRHEASDDPVKVPLVLVVGDNRGNVPQGADRVATFTGSLVVGRREATQGEPGQSSLVLQDRMVSSQHMAITPAPDEGVYELTDLSSTNGTIVDGEPVETTVRLRDGSVIFVGSHVLVFRVTTVAQRAAIEAELSNPLGPVATANPAFAMVCQKLRKLAAAGEELLLTGETGVGKEVYAEAIHRASGRTGRFVAINCAAIPRELVETELFGYARGAHSQAAMAKAGSSRRRRMARCSSTRSARWRPSCRRSCCASPRTECCRRSADCARGGSRPASSPRPAVPRRRHSREAWGCASIWRPASAPSRSGSRRCATGSKIWVRWPSFSWARGKADRADRFSGALSLPWPGNVRELGKVMTSAEALSRDTDRIAIEHLPGTILSAPRVRVRRAAAGNRGHRQTRQSLRRCSADFRAT